MKLKYMIICIAAICCQFTASAKDDAEEYHIKAVLFNGDSIEGYIRNDLKTGLKNMFSKYGSIHQYINVGKEPKGGETKRYSASEIKEYRFVETTEGYPEGFTVVSENINTPGLFKPHNSTRGFASELYRGENGSILKWNVWESTGGRDSRNRLVPAIGVKFKGAKAAYFFMINGRMSFALLLNYLKKQSPELRKIIDEYYNKSKDRKAHTQELKDNPSTILLLYDDFVRTHGPLNDTEAEETPLMTEEDTDSGESAETGE
ncbi:MAG: hypothetical protein HFJ94_02080 [Muribaculaceae bacterium]|nr:hypothetical protein [Muribaculaceae bacterium]